jgi:hypothetical protein
MRSSGEEASTRQGSGSGVEINGDRVSISGDVVGRHKIVNNEKESEMAKSKNTKQQHVVEGGVNFGGSRNVKIGGDVVGRDKNVTTNTGMSAEDVAKLFDSIYKKIDQKPKEDQADIRNAVDVIQTAAKSEAVEGKAPDESTVKMASQSLAMTAPDILKDVADVAMATLASPAAGVATIIRKVLAKIKQ